MHYLLYCLMSCLQNIYGMSLHAVSVSMHMRRKDSYRFHLSFAYAFNVSFEFSFYFRLRKLLGFFFSILFYLFICCRAHLLERDRLEFKVENKIKYLHDFDTLEEQSITPTGYISRIAYMRRMTTKWIIVGRDGRQAGGQALLNW